MSPLNERGVSNMTAPLPLFCPQMWIRPKFFLIIGQKDIPLYLLINKT